MKVKATVSMSYGHPPRAIVPGDVIECDEVRALHLMRADVAEPGDKASEKAYADYRKSPPRKGADDAKPKAASSGKPRGLGKAAASAGSSASGNAGS